jgi:uncharacterized coiled-coil DUF342 family protein
MKLAEALQARADLNRQIEQLAQRLTANVLVQQGEQPNEDPEELLAELDRSLDSLEELIRRINLTNSQVMVGDQTLTALMARRDVLAKKIEIYKRAAQQASSNTSRASGTEIKVLPALKVKDLQKQIDKLAKAYRELDNTIQQTNWSTELK